MRVEESSKKSHYLAVKVLYQGGQTEIVAMDVAEVGFSSKKKRTYMISAHHLVYMAPKPCLHRANVVQKPDDDYDCCCNFCRLVLQTGIT